MRTEESANARAAANMQNSASDIVHVTELPCALCHCANISDCITDYHLRLLVQLIGRTTSNVVAYTRLVYYLASGLRHALLQLHVCRVHEHVNAINYK